jgi:hypothetical protein
MINRCSWKFSLGIKPIGKKNKGIKAGVERQMSLPKSGSKDKLGRVTKAAVKSKFKPVSAAAKTDKAEKEKDKD